MYDRDLHTLIPAFFRAIFSFQRPLPFRFDDLKRQVPIRWP